MVGVNLTYVITGMQWQLNLISDELIKAYLLHDYLVPMDEPPSITVFPKGNVEANMMIEICAQPYIGWVEVNLKSDQ